MTNNSKLSFAAEVIDNMLIGDVEIASQLGFSSAAQIELLRAGKIKLPMMGCKRLAVMSGIPYSTVVRRHIIDCAPAIWKELVAVGLVQQDDGG